MNWKLIFSLSSFGIAISFSQIFGYGPLLVWPIVLVVSVCLITARATNRIPLHGFLVGAMIQIWVGAITAYLIFDLSRIGLVEVTPYGIHPQIINAFYTVLAAAVTGILFSAIVWLATKPHRRRISHAR